VERANLQWLLRQATPYERWRAPIDARLRWGMLCSGASIALSLATLWNLPLVAQVAQLQFLLLLRPQLGALLGQLAHVRLPLLRLDIVCAVVFAALAVATRGLRAGRAAWHWALLAQIAIGAANAFVLALALGIVLLNLALWLILAAFVLGLLVGVFRGPRRLDDV
jgi:hypothetical protein